MADGLRSGALSGHSSRRPGVRAKHGINMDTLEESGLARLSNEGRTGPGGKPSSQKAPCRAVVGQRLGVGTLCAARLIQLDLHLFCII